MREIDSTEDLYDYEAAAQFGVSSTSYSPLFAVPKEAVERFSDEDDQHLEEAFIEWWDSLGTMERAEVLRLDEKTGDKMVEELEFIDACTERGGDTEPIFE